MNHAALFFQRANCLEKQDQLNLGLLVAIWVLAAVMINPIGNFPLNDDWAYGWTVKTFLETGKFRLSDWTATNLLPQAILGVIFCLPFGFSFTSLRILTLLLSLVGVLAVYALLRVAKVPPGFSLFGALVLALNPIYFQLSYSFNSDIPSFTFVVLSMYLLLRGIQNNSSIELGLGIIVALIAILNRQSSLVILVAFGLAIIIRKGFRFRVVFAAFLPALLGIFLNFFYIQWLRNIDQVPLLYSLQIKQLFNTFSKGVLYTILTCAENLVIMFVYLGLFLLPFSIVHFSQRFTTLSSWQQKISLFTIFFGGAVGVVFAYKGRQMPFVGNVLETFGLGPQSLEGYSALLSSGEQIAIGRGWKVLTVLGAVGGILLFSYLVSAFIEVLNTNQVTEASQKWLLVFNLSFVSLYLLAIAALNKKYWFDRYLILLIPMLMLLIVGSNIKFPNKKLNQGIFPIAAAIFLLYGAFTVSATHDYLAVNRVRWQSLNYLMNELRVLPEQIDGGFEFSGLYFGNRLETCNHQYQTSKPTDLSWGSFTCLWREGRGNGEVYQYMIGLLPNPKYRIEKQYSCRKWLPWREQKLYVLRRLEA